MKTVYDLVCEISDETDCFKDFYENEMNEVIEELFIDADLNYEELEVIKLRYGFYGKMYSFREIREILKKSKFAVSKCHDEALDKFRASNLIGVLAEYTVSPEHAMSMARTLREKYAVRRY